MLNMFSRFALVLGFGLWLTSPVMAAGLAKPTGEVVLSISGAISNTNVDGRADFDMEMLKALPVTSFKTSTIWTEGVNSFTGVSLKALMDAVGATGSNLHSMAINDYAVEIPATDAVEDGPILAYTMNERPMPVRDKGPLWIIYPFDANAGYKTEAIYARAIWQLSKIEIQK